jgi:methionine sulfoxide reductase heme-binding subunit
MEMLELAASTVPWTISRAAGIAALLAASCSVAVGLAIATRKVRATPGELKAMHEALSIATIVAIVVHAAALLFDGWLEPSAADLLIPFVGEHAPFWTGLGIIGGWALLVLGLTYYVRGRIGPRRWKTMHRFAAIAWLLCVGHALGAGTDAGAAWFLASVGAVVLPVATALGFRWLPTVRRRPTPAA